MSACRYATPDGTGWVYCRSRLVKFAPGGFPLVKERKCESCQFKNRAHGDPRAEIKLDGKPLVQLLHSVATAPPKPSEKIDKTYPCVHRGQRVGERKTKKCCGGKGGTMFVFACDLRTECTIATDVGLAVCRLCADREAPHAAQT